MSEICSYADIAKMVDHALLSPALTLVDMRRGIALGLAYDIATVCIMPSYLALCAEQLAGSGVKPSTTIGFPHGGNSTAGKVAESAQAIQDGGCELDMVCNISKVLSEDWAYVRADIQAVVEVTHAAGKKVKVIFENCYLQDAHKIKLCEICAEAGADWVKTSTGFGTGGATDADLILMRAHSPACVQVKAAGGIRDLERALQVRAIGCTRIGCSATQPILDELRARLQLPAIDTAKSFVSSSY